MIWGVRHCGFASIALLDRLISTAFGRSRYPLFLVIQANGLPQGFLFLRFAFERGRVYQSLIPTRRAFKRRWTRMLEKEFVAGHT